MATLGRSGSLAPLTSADIPDNSITAAKIVDSTILAGDLAPNSVDSSELIDGSVDLSHMSADSVDSNQYVDGSIDTIHVGDNQITLAKMAGGTDGNIISYDASGDPVAIATGDDGEVLTSTGAGSPPAFEAVGGGFASGTKMIFNQTAAPTGWTKVTGSGNNNALRLVTGSVGTGGTEPFTTAFADKTFTPTISAPTASGGSVSAHSLARSEVGDDFVLAGTNYQALHYMTPSDTHVGTGNNQGYTHGESHTHGMGQPTISAPTSNAVPIDVEVSYVDVIIATKD